VQPNQGFTNNEQNIQFVAVPVDQTPQFSFNEFRAGGSIHTGPNRGTFRSGSRRGRRAEDSTDPKVRMMLIVWMLHLFLSSKIK